MSVLKSLSNEIKDILYGYIACESISSTEKEQEAELYFLDYFKSQPYFIDHPEYCGAQPVPDDPFGRAAVWAMVRSSDNARDTIVCIHHHDVVTVEDFKNLKKYAFSPDELEEQLAQICDSFTTEARADFLSGDWLFGRGGCDMKGGGAIQMALLSAYGRQIMDGAMPFDGNVIVLSVPDEENLSAGMRAGTVLLNDLKEKYGLKYRLMINSEPHQRKTPDTGIFSYGSIGKVMPFVYIRGCLAHAGKVFEGLNPTHVMSEIVRRTEVNMAFSDIVGKEAAPPPTWLYLRENKLSYDVSMPLTINGCLSVLTLDQSPVDVMLKLRSVCYDAFDDVIDRMNKNYRIFTEATGRANEQLPWKTSVVEYGELLSEAEASYGASFAEAYSAELKRIRDAIRSGEESIIMANFKLVDFVYNYIDDLSPRIVIGLMPPYYPNVANRLSEQSPEIEHLHETLLDFTRNNYLQEYTCEDYYTGISDLSYSGLRGYEDIEECLKSAMPFFGEIYSLPLKEIAAISMPGVNIGPWGKDFHKLTERVFKEDLYIRTPEILDHAIRRILS